MNIDKIRKANQKEGTQYLAPCFDEQTSWLHPIESLSSC